MPFVKLESSHIEYSGESFTKSIKRKSGSAWESTDILSYEMLDSEGAVRSSGSLTKSDGDLVVTFTVPSIDTTGIKGKYLILVHLKNTEDATFDDVVAEYDMTYLEKKAK